ncbi:MAG: CsgG/HfaB family protein [Bdellovibrionales bacterium]
MRIRFWATSLLILTQVGCAALGRRSEKPAGPEERDVPMNARGSEEAPRHRILVLPFLNERMETSKNVPEVARQTVVRELLRTGHFVVVALEDFPQDPKTFMTEENDYDMAQIAKIAATMGVAAVLEGKVMSIRAKRVGDSVGLIRQLKAQISTQVRVRVFAGKNSKELLNEMRSADTEATTTRVGENGDLTQSIGDDPELVRAAVRQAFMSSVPNIVRAVEKLSWEGRVAMIAGERVYINAGRLSGLQIGDILKVTEEGDDVYDPETGRFIGTAPGRLKGTVEVVSYFGKDGAISVIHSGSGFNENDRVELY